jgi:mono/diheme cytochrome c family protein
MKSLLKQIIILSLLATGASGCYLKHAQPYYVYAPDMHYSMSLQPEKEGAMRQPVHGTIPRGFRPYSLLTMDEAKLHLNPLPRDRETLTHGKQLFNVYCIVCHGQYGEGNGLVVAKTGWPRPLFARPPTLQSEKIHDYKDGQIFHVITMGQNLMPSYAEKLDNDERWAIIHYIRVLYRAKHPTDADMKAAADFVEEN